MTFFLETSRLILRSFELPDAETFACYRSDPEVARYQGWEAPFSLERAQEFVAGLQSTSPGQPGEWYQVALVLKSSGTLIGDCAFQRLEADPRQAEVGITLARPFQGQGYGQEALTALLAYLFDKLGLHRVRANCDPQNSASARLLERCGLRYEGRFVESLWFKGQWADEDWYALLDREWQARVEPR